MVDKYRTVTGADSATIIREGSKYAAEHDKSKRKMKRIMDEDPNATEAYKAKIIPPAAARKVAGDIRRKAQKSQTPGTRGKNDW